MHHVLAFAALFVGEGGTMGSEAAGLGTPSMFVNRLTRGYLDELQDRYRLLYCYSDEHLALEKAQELLARPQLREDWRGRRERMLGDKVDVTKYIVDMAESSARIRHTRST